MQKILLGAMGRLLNKVVLVDHGCTLFVVCVVILKNKTKILD